MKKSHNSSLKEELILLAYEAESREDVLHALADLLYQHGAVKASYHDAVFAREKQFPTGLPTQDIKVALPHAGVEHVNYSALAIAILQHPVSFYQMDDPDHQLDVEIVLMLANAEPNEQIQTLRQLCELFDEPEALRDLKMAQSPKEVINIIDAKYRKANRKPDNR
jgi:PTS system galactitol-specific IIA component